MKGEGRKGVVKKRKRKKSDVVTFETVRTP
jgi:hypothetical protein